MDRRYRKRPDGLRGVITAFQFLRIARLVSHNGSQWDLRFSPGHNTRTATPFRWHLNYLYPQYLRFEEISRLLQLDATGPPRKGDTSTGQLPSYETFFSPNKWVPTYASW